MTEYERLMNWHDTYLRIASLISARTGPLTQEDKASIDEARGWAAEKKWQARELIAQDQEHDGTGPA